VNKLNRCLQPKGFTLVELLVVTIIIAILTIISIPSFRRTYNSLQLSTSANDLASALRYAQERSIAQRNNYRFILNIDNNNYWMEKLETTEEGEEYQRIKGKLGRTFYVPKFLTIEPNSTEIIFNPDGSSDLILIYIIDQKENYFTIASEGISGYVKVYDYKKE
jgi:prepilin-type N-terminal cleavage/methylation domain-containing protein